MSRLVHPSDGEGRDDAIEADLGAPAEMERPTAEQLWQDERDWQRWYRAYMRGSIREEGSSSVA